MSSSSDSSDSRSDMSELHSEDDTGEYTQPKPHKSNGFSVRNFQEREALDQSDSSDEVDEEEEVANEADNQFLDNDDDVVDQKVFRDYDKRRRLEERKENRMRLEMLNQISKDYAQVDETEFIFDDSALSQPFSSYRIALEPSTGSNQLFHVKCKPGKELVVISYLYAKFAHSPSQYNLTFAAYTPKISSGFIYVEARTLADANTLCSELPFIMNLNRMKNLKYSEMAKAMTIPRTEVDFHPGNFVEILKDSQSGYFVKGDIGQVINININRNKVMVKLIPRIDYDRIESDTLPEKKSKAAKEVRIPQADFQPERIINHATITDTTVQIGDSTVEFKEYDNALFYGPFLYHEIETKKLQKVAYIQMDFGKKFQDNFYDFEQRIPYFKNNMYSALGLTNSTTFNQGDIARILEPHEYQDVIVDVLGVQGNIIHVAPRATNEVEKAQYDGIEFDIQSDLLEKYFHEGDRVKIIAGANRGKIGIVLGVDMKTFTAQIQITSIDAIVSEKVANLAHTRREEEIQIVLGQYRLNDFVVLLDKQRGVIWRIENDIAFILLDTGVAISADLSRILCKARDDTVRASNGKAITISSVVKVKDERYNATVIHTTHSKVFLQSQQKQTMGGLFVRPPSDITVFTTPKNVAPSAGSGGFVVQRPKQDLSLKGQTIKIIKGPYKGLLADVKEATGEDMHVILHTTKKIVRLFRTNGMFTVVKKDNNDFMKRLFSKDDDLPAESAPSTTQQQTYDAPTYAQTTTQQEPAPSNYGNAYNSVYSPQSASPSYGSTTYGSPSSYAYNQPYGGYGSSYGDSYGSPASSAYAYGGQASPAAVPYGSPGAQPYGSPAAAQPYGSPAAAAQPYGSPTAAQPYGSPAAAQPYGSPTAAQPYGSPTSYSPPYGNMYYQQNKQN